MWWRDLFVRICFVELIFTGSFALADCPSADLTGDCFVDFGDFAVIGANWLSGYDWNDVNTLANQWLTTDPCVPDDMAYIPDGEFQMGDHHDGYSPELPVHAVLLDWFFITKYEITNQQYCDYLNSACDACDIKVDDRTVYAWPDSSNSFPYCHIQHRADTQIDYNDVSETFSVMAKGGRDMSHDPMVAVTWYGAAAYCNWRSQQEGYQQCYDPCDPNWPCNFSKHGYRLATEAEWEYAARGGLSGRRFPWGNTISHSHANYYADPCGHSYDVNPTEGYHPDYNDVSPYTAPVGSFASNGYGLCETAGNVWEWCNDWCDYSYYDWCKNTCGEPCTNPTGPDSGSERVLRGGGWHVSAGGCRVTFRFGGSPRRPHGGGGFRIVLDLK
ncbi:MAG: formylglycine-generating enzyme family protein [Planctomycetota bacterium]